MASGKTEHYGLSRWEATDQVVMKDFNDDNEKIDAGIKEAKDAADNAQATAENLAAVAFTPENLPFVVGTYTGDGAASRIISLGFTPRAVFVQRYDACPNEFSSTFNRYYGGFALQGKNLSSSADSGVDSWVDGKSIVAVVENGFQISTYSEKSTVISSNLSTQTYFYIALR